MIRFPGDRDAATWALAERDVLLHPFHFYDGEDDRHVVASLLSEPAILREALGRLEHGTPQGPEG
jgi:hypothetical protein